MPTRSVRRGAAILGSARADQAPLYVDADDNKLKVVSAGSGTTEVEVLDTTNAFTMAGALTQGAVGLTTSKVGAVNGSTVSAVERGDSILHQTVITLTTLPLTLRDTQQGLGVKIYDFPVGQITILNASGSVQETTTAVLTTTLNASVTYNWGVGTMTQTSATLATTEQNIINVTEGTASATINVEAAASSSTQTVAPLAYNGKSTAIDAYFNVAVATAGDIDADATTTWDGTITLTWLLNDNV